MSTAAAMPQHPPSVAVAARKKGRRGRADRAEPRIQTRPIQQSSTQSCFLIPCIHCDLPHPQKLPVNFNFLSLGYTEQKIVTQSNRVDMRDLEHLTVGGLCSHDLGISQNRVPFSYV